MSRASEDLASCFSGKAILYFLVIIIIIQSAFEWKVRGLTHVVKIEFPSVMGMVHLAEPRDSKILRDE